MWKCHKCGKPVYFAERKQSLGYDWHPECLRCEECCKRLNPGQHAEHKGVPYCHVPCYGALFGPQLFGHGTRVESHTSFGKKDHRSASCTSQPRTHLESKLKVFNQYYDGRSGEIRSREVNGRLVLEGALRICWGVMHMIHLKEDDDQRTVVTVRKRNSYRSAINGLDDSDNDTDDTTTTDDSGKPCSSETGTSSCETGALSSSSSSNSAVHDSKTLPSKLELKDWDELDELLQVERPESNDKPYQTMPSGLPTPVHSNNEEPLTSSPEALLVSVDNSEVSVDAEEEEVSSASSAPEQGQAPGRRALERRSISLTSDLGEDDTDDEDELAAAAILCAEEGQVPRRRLGSTAIRRRPGRRRSRTKLKRRCSINGHFYNRETSFFLPPHGSLMSVWVTSLVSTQEVINLLLEKYKVDSHPSNFALFVVRDNGEQRRLREDEYPLVVRVMLGPHEEVARLFLMDRQHTQEISCEVAQFLNLSGVECRAILEQYSQEEEREVKRVRARFREMRRRIKQRMEDLKVRL